MKTLYLFCLFFYFIFSFQISIGQSTSAPTFQNVDLTEQWKLFKSQFNRHYTDSEDITRFLTSLYI